MQRYFVLPEQMTASSVMLEGDDARHLAQVMRAKEGERFIVCDGQGRDALVQVTSIDKNEVCAEIVEMLPVVAEMAWRVTVAQSLPKGDKLETIIQKGTEAGAASFLPFVSKRTVVQYDERKEAKRIDRWRKIAKEAAEQSHRSVVPAIEAVCSWKQMLRIIADYDLAILCYEEEGRSGIGLRAALHDFRRQHPGTGSRILVLIGPEGGFAPEEAEEALAAGARAVGLGRRILRTETAALYALACLAYESGELGGNENA